jgi:20S proteasome alpha/beta subunit
MITYGQFIEFEHEVPKSIQINDSCLVLFAGDSVNAAAIIRNAREAPRSEEASTSEISMQVAQQYHLQRLSVVDQQVFAPRGIALHQFYGGLQTQMVPQIAMQLDNQAATLNIGIDLLVAGVDDFGGHVNGVGHPGQVFQTYESVGFHAVGSGAIHAIQSLIERQQAPHRTLTETLFNVVVSKRRAEAAPGVGHDSDVYIVGKSAITRVESSVLDQVDSMYNESTNRAQVKDSDEFKALEEALGGQA